MKAFRSGILSLAIAAAVLSSGAVRANPISPKGELSVVIPSLTATKTQVGPVDALNMGVMRCFNPNAAVAYVQIFDNVPAGVTVGTSVPTFSLPIAPTSVGGLDIGFGGLRFSLGITVAATTTVNGAAAPTTPLNCSFGYN